MLDGIANAYRQGCQRMRGVSGATALLTSEGLERSGGPYLLETTAANWLQIQSSAMRSLGRWAWSFERKVQRKCYKLPRPWKDN